MRPADSFLILRLEGPLQAWGARARWTIRDTASEPTKSGMIGLLAACLGWGVDRDAEVAELASALLLGIRVDRPGRPLVDYHTVGGGRPPIGVMSAAGIIKITATTKEPETVVSRRAYLADASFLVVIGGSAELLARLEQALMDPVWPPFLGRKCCPPAVPLLPTRVVACDLEGALKRVPFGSRKGEQAPDQVRALVEVPPGDGTVQAGLYRRRQDVPLSMVYRRFGFRTVRELLIPVADLPEAGSPQGDR